MATGLKKKISLWSLVEDNSQEIIPLEFPTLNDVKNFWADPELREAIKSLKQKVNDYIIGSSRVIAKDIGRSRQLEECLSSRLDVIEERLGIDGRGQDIATRLQAIYVHMPISNKVPPAKSAEPIVINEQVQISNSNSGAQESLMKFKAK